MKFSLVLSALFAGLAIASPVNAASGEVEARSDAVPEGLEIRACKLKDNHCTSNEQCCSVSHRHP